MRIDREFATRKLGLGSFLKRSRFVLIPYDFDRRHQGVVAKWSACPPVDLATRVRFLVPFAFFFLSFSEASSLKKRLRTPALDVFSVAEWLALLRCQ